MLRAYAVQEPFGMTVAVTVVDHPEAGGYDNKPRILRLSQRGENNGDNGTAAIVGWEDVDPQIRHEPTLRVSLEAAFAIVDALGELRHGTSELRALRDDYDAERKRVDRLIETLSAVVTEGAR